MISLAFSKCLEQVHDEVTRVIMHFWSAVCGSAEIREYTSIIGACIYIITYVLNSLLKQRQSTRIPESQLKDSKGPFLR